MEERIGFIGLGRMGRPMATNLLRKGFAVIVYVIVPESVSALARHGAEATGAERVPMTLGAAARESLNLARAGGLRGKDFSTLLDALCESCGAPPVRFTQESPPA